MQISRNIFCGFEWDQNMCVLRMFLKYFHLVKMLSKEVEYQMPLVQTGKYCDCTEKHGPS